jgi:hypothetical protein
MVRLGIIGGIVVAVSVLMLGVVSLGGGMDTLPPILGMQPICAVAAEPCWLVLGGGHGVLVVGLAGVGVVSLTLYGAGLLFATGQLAAGGIALGQCGVGLSGFAGQVGCGFVAFGQGVGGVVADGQGSVGIKGAPFLRTFNAELSQILRFRGPLP